MMIERDAIASHDVLLIADQFNGNVTDKNPNSKNELVRGYGSGDDKVLQINSNDGG